MTAMRECDPLQTGRLVLYCASMSVPPRPYRQARAEITRTRLIDTAAIAFAKHGLDGVSFSDLVKASGLSKGAFYFHFPSKEDLALTVFRTKQEELVGRLLADPTPETAADRLVVLFRRRAQLLREEPGLGCVTRLGSELNVRSSPGSTYAGFLDLALEGIAGIVREGQASGEFRADLDPDAMARVIFASVVGMDTLSLLFSGGEDLEERSEELLRVIQAALLDGSRTRVSSRESKKGGSS